MFNTAAFTIVVPAILMDDLHRALAACHIDGVRGTQALACRHTQWALVQEAREAGIGFFEVSNLAGTYRVIGEEVDRQAEYLAWVEADLMEQAAAEEAMAAWYYQADAFEPAAPLPGEDLVPTRWLNA